MADAPQPHVIIPGVSPSRGDWLRPLVGLSCLAGLICAGVYLTDHLQRQRATEAARNEAERIAAGTRQEQVRLAAAIREGRASVGMTERQVWQARGEPDFRFEGAALSEETRAAGADHGWGYHRADDRKDIVFFNAKKIAVYVAVAVKP